MSIYNMKSNKPSDCEEKAFSAGYDAALRGDDWKSNPHPTLSLQNIAWANGHICGTDYADFERRGIK